MTSVGRFSNETEGKEDGRIHSTEIKQCMQFGFCQLKYYYSFQVNEIIYIEALHKDLCITFGYITKMVYCTANPNSIHYLISVE